MKIPDYNFSQMAQTAIAEVAEVLARTSQNDAEQMCAEIFKARRIACYGVGREGLMVKALCMRLMHLDIDAHVVGDMTTPPIGNGDLLIASTGPGAFSTVMALENIALEAGARVAIVTAQTAGDAAKKADVVIELKAQTMANDENTTASLLPMGSLFEVAQHVFFDLISILLREEVRQTPKQMCDRHTNLE